MPKIMIADDDVTTQIELEEYLNEMKHEVVGIADRSDRAVDMARDLKPDLILMDVNMPGEMDGISAAECIKREMDVAVVFVTGYGDPEYVERAKQVEPFGFVMKPFDETEINAVIEIGLYKKELESKLKLAHRRLERTNFSLQMEIETRKKTEQVLKENEEKYRSLFENAPVGIGIADEKGNILDFNDAMLRPGGYSRQDILEIGNLKRLYYLCSTRERILKRASEQGFLDQEPVRFRRKDGTPYDALLSLRPIRFKRKKCWQAIVQDVTEHKRMEEKREETLSQLQATLEATADGIIVVCLDQRISVYNRRFMKIWHIEGSLMDSGDAKQVFDYILDQLTEPEIFSRKVRAAFADSGLNTFDRLYLKDGRSFEIYSRPQKLDGEMIGRVWSSRDVSRRCSEKQKK